MALVTMSLRPSLQGYLYGLRRLLDRSPYCTPRLFLTVCLRLQTDIDQTIPDSRRVQTYHRMDHWQPPADDRELRMSSSRPPPGAVSRGPTRIRDPVEQSVARGQYKNQKEFPVEAVQKETQSPVADTQQEAVGDFGLETSNDPQRLGTHVPESLTAGKVVSGKRLNIRSAECGERCAWWEDKVLARRVCCAAIYTRQSAHPQISNVRGRLHASWVLGLHLLADVHNFRRGKVPKR